MSIIVKRKRHYLTRVPIGLFFIGFIALSPIIVGISMARISELTTGIPCNNEGNCAWLVLPWLGMITLPIGLLLLVVFLLIVFIDTLKLSKNV